MVYTPKGCDQQGRIPDAAYDSAEVCAGDDWIPLTVSESVKFWATILGVPAAVLLLGFAAAVWP